MCLALLLLQVRFDFRSKWFNLGWSVIPLSLVFIAINRDKEITNQPMLKSFWPEIKLTCNKIMKSYPFIIRRWPPLWSLLCRADNRNHIIVILLQNFQTVIKFISLVQVNQLVIYSSKLGELHSQSLNIVASEYGCFQCSTLPCLRPVHWFKWKKN